MKQHEDKFEAGTAGKVPILKTGAMIRKGEAGKAKSEQYVNANRCRQNMALRIAHFGDWTLFVFNLADAALTLGPAVLILTYLWPTKAPGST